MRAQSTSSAPRQDPGPHRGAGPPTAGAVGAAEAHHPDRPGASWVVSEHPKIGYQVTRGGSAALPASSIEGADLLLSLEPVVADSVERIRQIKLMRLATVVAIHVGPVIGHQPIERVP